MLAVFSVTYILVVPRIPILHTRIRTYTITYMTNVVYRTLYAVYSMSRVVYRMSSVVCREKYVARVVHNVRYVLFALFSMPYVVRRMKYIVCRAYIVPIMEYRV